MRASRTFLVLSGGAALVALGACGLDWTPEAPAGDGGAGPGSSGPASVTSGGAEGGAAVSSSSMASSASSASSASAGGAGGAGGEGGSGGAGGAAPVDCDAQPSCLACNACSIDAGGPCQALRDLCFANDFCELLDGCINGPTGCNGDLSNYNCADYCIRVSPLGEAPYRAMMKCALCDTCVTNCASIQNYWCI
ncbi:MAG: hypothetical protein WKG00_40605 [Polyangiaceae bacterium]